MQWDEMATVGRVARAHGNRGNVIVNPETDFPEERFRPGSVMFVRRGAAIEPLTVAGVRFHQGRPIVEFEGVDTMSAAEALQAVELRIPTDALQQLPAGSFYRHDLIGCLVATPDGREIGKVTGVEGGGLESRLVVDGVTGEILIPLAEEICVTVDVPGRRIVVRPLEGLLELNAPGSRSGRPGRRR
jgi:16S rRNA processing protein RimM